MGLIFFHMICQFLMIFFVYFKPIKDNVGPSVWYKAVISFIVLTILMLIFISVMLYYESTRLYWYPYLMIYLFLKFFIICNIIFEQTRF